MRIATWNINGLRARIDYIDEWITARDPDLLAFQELKTPNDLFPHDHFEVIQTNLPLGDQFKFPGKSWFWELSSPWTRPKYIPSSLKR